MYDGDLTCMSHSLMHVRGGSALRFTNLLQPRVNGGVTSPGVMSTGVASPTRESNGTVAAKCRCSICSFSQGSVVLHHGLRHCSDEGCMMFMCVPWLTFMQGVW